MKKDSLLMITTTAIMLLGMSQSVMAKDGMVQCKMDEVCIMNDTIKSDVSYKVSDKKVIFPQGFYLEYDSYWRIVFPDGTEIVEDDLSYKRIGKLVGIKKLGEPSIIKWMRLPESVKNSNLSDDEATKLIKEKLSIVWPDCDFNTNDFFGTHEGVLEFYHIYNKSRFLEALGGLDGYFFDGRYYSRNTLYKMKDAKEAAADKNFKAEIAKFKRKYGFDPVNTSWKQTIKAGRSVAAFDASNAFLKEHGYKIMRVKLTIDDGASKCYDMFMDGKKQGYFWTRGGRITSVVWR